LDALPGFGAGRLRAVRDSLAGRFRRPITVSSPGTPLAAKTVAQPPSITNQPTVDELLAVDQEYRTKAAADRLPKLAPRRYNPTGEAWLPILHTLRGQTHYTALYSNTACAHDLGTIKDWVVIYRDGHGHGHDGAGQWTVVTAHVACRLIRPAAMGRAAPSRLPP